MHGDPETCGPMGQAGNWGFIAFFLLPEGRDVSQVQTEVCWEGKMSPWPIITFLDILQSIFHYHSHILLRK
jgi:hypothetical protein